MTNRDDRVIKLADLYEPILRDLTEDELADLRARPPMIISGWSDGGTAGSIHWFASSSREGIVECGKCGNTYDLEVGEEIDFSDPRMCEHGPRRA